MTRNDGHDVRGVLKSTSPVKLNISDRIHRNVTYIQYFLIHSFKSIDK